VHRAPDDAVMTARTTDCGSKSHDERGAALVEFALVSLVLYVMFASTIDFGRLLFSAQGIQDVARLSARELATAPLGAVTTFDDALDQTRARIYDHDRLVLDITDLDDAAVDATVAQWPIVNRALRPLMIVEEIDGRRLLRYPGTLLATPGAPSGFSVAIPRIVARGVGGVETLEWLDVVEEVRTDRACPMRGPFSLAYDSAQDTCGALGADPVAASQRGLVAVRINYPYQAAAMTAFTPNPGGPFEPTLGTPILADDTGVTAPAPPAGTLLNDDGRIGPYAGPYGLGRQLAFGRTVRPYRSVVTAQAIFRREVFQ
ncbi:MAG: pilus assembly protein, partial [Vicinamibacterales bacterium]